MKTLGLDVHSGTFTMAIFNARGRFMQMVSEQTSEKTLIRAVQAVSGKKTLVVEESHLAQWVKRTLEPFVDRLVICDPKRNKWIAQDDYADDQTSARKLAHLWMGGFIKEIKHPDDGMAYLRALFVHYYDLVRQGVRFKNKLSAIYRQIAIKVKGRGLYSGAGKKEWLELLRAWPELRFEAKHAFENIERLERQQTEVFKRMVKRVKHKAAFKRLIGMPGAGPVIAVGYLAIIGSPFRFSNKRKLWRYACLANCAHISDDKVYKDRSSPSGNRILKYLVFQHFRCATNCKKPNRFSEQFAYHQARGLGKKVARRHVCRSILATVRAIWTKGEMYRE